MGKKSGRGREGKGHKKRGHQFRLPGPKALSHRVDTRMAEGKAGDRMVCMRVSEGARGPPLAEAGSRRTIDPKAAVGGRKAVIGPSNELLKMGREKDTGRA